MSKYKMRSLKTLDVFAMSKILKKLDVQLNLDLSKSNKKKSAEDAGKEFMLSMLKTALENLHQAQDEVNGFLADLVGITAEEFNELEIEDTIEIITLFKNQKGLEKFFALAGK